MEENNDIFKSVNQKKPRGSFFKTVVVPFLSGIIGASLVIGTCLGVPKIKEKIFGEEEKTSNSWQNQIDTSSSQVNATAVSLEEYSGTSIGVAAKVQPSIVGIEIEYSVNSFFGKQTAQASGSGIIISEDGYILTNNHVVSTESSSSYYQVTEAVSVKVKLYNDETLYDAKIIGADSETDLAVIKIEKTGLTPAELGDSNSVQVGEFAMAVGNPLGLSSSVTSGIVSAVNREIITDENEKYTVIQTDAAINSGNSGGALVNSKGQVIGINTLKLSGTGVEGIGFAIPISSTTEVVKQLIEYNKVIRPYIGITVQTISEEEATKYKLVVGAYVREVEDFSAAQKAGIKVGDVITEIDGEKIETNKEVTEIKNKHKIGDTLKIKLYRNGEYIDVEVTLAEQP